MRLNKFIASSGVCSRRNADELIKQGRVEVKGKAIVEPGLEVDPQTDIVSVDGRLIRPEEKEYYLLNKPAGFICTTKDERNRPLVTNLIKTDKKIFPVGRLDFNTTGVLLLTNDGDFSNLMLHPTHRIPRNYTAWLDRALTDEDRERLLRGIVVDRKRGRFVELEFAAKSSQKIVDLVTEEGRNHFVKDMFSTLGYNVKKLNRNSFGPFNHKGLPLGAYRILSWKDISGLLKSYEHKK